MLANLGKHENVSRFDCMCHSCFMHMIRILSGYNATCLQLQLRCGNAFGRIVCVCVFVVLQLLKALTYKVRFWYAGTS